jgi:hypothetical protein
MGETMIGPSMSDRLSKYTTEQIWTRYDAKVALSSGVLNLQSRIAIAGALSRYASVIDAEQLWQGIDYLHGLM